MEEKGQSRRSPRRKSCPETSVHVRPRNPGGPSLRRLCSGELGSSGAALASAVAQSFLQWWTRAWNHPEKGAWLNVHERECAAWTSSWRILAKYCIRNRKQEIACNRKPCTATVFLYNFSLNINQCRNLIMKLGKKKTPWKTNNNQTSFSCGNMFTSLTEDLKIGYLETS